MNVIMLLSALILMVLSSCNTDSSKPEVEEMDSTQADISVVPDSALFGLKSGVIEMESEAMDMKQFVVMYFDSWGHLLMNEIQMEVMGQKSHIMTIIKDGWSYQIDMIQRTGMKFRIDTSSYEQINYLQMTDEMMKENHMEYIGETEVLGRKCREYKIDMKKENMQMKVAIWKGITMKSEGNMMGIKTSVTVTDIQENVEIPKEKFEIPADIKFSEITEGPQSATSIAE